MARQYTAVNLYAVCLALVTSLASTSSVSLNSEDFSFIEGEQQLNKRNSNLRFQEVDDTIVLPRTYLDSLVEVLYDDARLQELKQKLQQLDTKLMEQEKQCQTSCISNVQSIVETKLMELQKIGQKVEHIETKLLESQIFEQKVQHLLETKTTELQKIDQKVQHLDSRLTELQTIEQKVERLESKLTELQKIDQKVQDLDRKLTEQEKIGQKVEHIEIKLAEWQKIKEAVERLESKLTELQKIGPKIEHIETGLTRFQRQYETSQEVIYLRMNETAQILRKQVSKGRNFRTCQELHQSDGSLSSGMYWIDPDGYGFEDPIQVRCDMETGKTSIPHDSENSTNVGHCATPGCYSKLIKYSAPVRQMAALAELSNECHQPIRYDCNSAPFEINGVAQSWWNDRNGVAQFFWSGSNRGHTCQCGIDKNCVKVPYKCNCDSVVSNTSLSDIGVITDKIYLPITQLNFGGTQLANSSGIFKLGRFECTGQVNLEGGMPKSCSDLWKIGHTVSGIYSVMGSKYVETVYCDFGKFPLDHDFQKRIGYSDVKSLPGVYFYVQKKLDIRVVRTITFDLTRLNIGGAMDVSSGIFTAPRDGIYFFAFTGVGNYNHERHGYSVLRVALKLNGSEVGRGLTHSGDHNAFLTISLHSTLELKAGDRVWLAVVSIEGVPRLYDDSSIYTHFSGHLLHEYVRTP